MLFGPIVSGFKLLMGYSAVVGGVDMGFKIAKRVTKDTPAQPIVSGIGDTFMNILDPADFTGHRKKKEQQAAAQLDAAQDKAQSNAQKAKEQKKAKEEARKRAAEAEKRATKAEKKAAALEAEVEKLRLKGEKQKAAAAAEEAKQARRYAFLSKKAAAESNASSGKQALAMARAAQEIAKMANNPQNAINAINQQNTPEGKSLVASLVDAINREAEPNYDAIVARLSEGDPETTDSIVDASVMADDGYGFDDVDGIVSGPGCNACKVGKACSGGGAPCGGGPRGEVPDPLISGDAIDFGEDDDGGDFLRWTFGEDAGLIAGPTEDREVSFRGFLEDGQIRESWNETEPLFADAVLAGPVD